MNATNNNTGDAAMPVSSQVMDNAMSSRRKFLKGAVAAMSISAPPVALASDADAELLRLGGVFDAAYANFLAVLERLNVAEDQVHALCPPRPEEIQTPPENYSVIRKLRIEQVGTEEDPSEESRREIMAENERRRAVWEAQRRMVEDECGLTAAEKDEKALSSEIDLIACEIVEAPAHTLAGLLVKLRVAKVWWIEGKAILESVIPDVERMTGELA